MRLPQTRPAPFTRRVAQTMSWRALRRELALAWAVVVRTVRLYLDDHCGTYAAAIAFYAIFSLVPLSLVTVSIFGLVVDEDRITRFVFEQLPLEETPSVRRNVEEIVSRAHEVSAAGIGVGLVALLWSASGIFGALRRGLNRAIGRRDPRPYWRGKLLDLALIPSAGLLVIVAIIGTTAVQLTIERADDLGPAAFDASGAVRFVTFVVTTAVSFTAFLLLYKFVPKPRPAWRQALASSVFALVLFELARLAATLVIRYMPFNRDTALYAGFGTMLTVLFWIFVTASVLLLGAEFGRALKAAGGARDRETATFLKPFR